MASGREAGWAALQQGDIEEAIRLLSAACQDDPADYEAHLYLGAAFGRAGRHHDAISALTEAVRLRPADARARYNLGVALEKAGHVEQALEGYRQAFTLDPTYASAQDAVLRLEAIVAAPAPLSPPAPALRAQSLDVHTPPVPGIEPSSSAPSFDFGLSESHTSSQTSPSPPSAGIVGSPVAATERGVQNNSAHLYPIDASGRTQAPEIPAAQAAPSTASEPETTGFTAKNASGSAALPSHGLLSDYAPSPNAPAGPSAILAPYAPDTMPPVNYEDEIDIPKAIRDFERILIMPDRFFREQAGKYGLMSPMLMVGIFLVLRLIEVVVANGGHGFFSLMLGIALSPISLAFAGMQMLVVYLVSGLFVHFLGWMFGNRQDYAVSVRACVYSDVPRCLLTFIGSMVTAFFILPAYMAHPITSVELEQAIGLPAGTIINGPTVPGNSGPPIVVGSPRAGSSQPGATAPPAPTGRAGTAKPGASANTPKPANVPTLSIYTFFGLAQLMWRKFGSMAILWLVLTTVGWFWSSILLALAIHRLQQIPAAAAAGVVVIMYALGLLLLLLVGWALHGVIVNVIQLLIQMQGMPLSGGGPGR